MVERQRERAEEKKEKEEESSEEKDDEKSKNGTNTKEIEIPRVIQNKLFELLA